MDAFRRTRGGFTARISGPERTFLSRPFADVAALLGHAEPPVDALGELAARSEAPAKGPAAVDDAAPEVVVRPAASAATPD